MSGSNRRRFKRQMRQHSDWFSFTCRTGTCWRCQRDEWYRDVVHWTQQVSRHDT